MRAWGFESPLPHETTCSVRKVYRGGGGGPANLARGASKSSVLGAALALGAPLGLMSLRALLAERASLAWLRAEIASDAWT